MREETTMHPDFDQLVLRLGTVHDDAVLERLALLDGKPLPHGRHIVAELDGIVVAAQPVGCGDLIADPFRRTAHLVPLLELHAKQLLPATGGHRRSLRTTLRAIHV
jgi:hypothetical protein